MGVLLFATILFSVRRTFYYEIIYLDYHQQIAVSFGLDMNDLLILRWFVDFRNTDGMEIKIVGDKHYYWVNYKKVLEDLPILKINSKDVLRRRFKKLCDCEVLEFYLEKGTKGTFTYYNTGKNYKILLYNLCDSKHYFE